MSNSNWNPVEELCGYISETGALEQLPNTAVDPKKGFSFDITLVPENALGLWHSHPSNDANLSVEDYINFLQFPEYIHRIYTKETYAEYYIRNGVVYRQE